MPLGPKLIFFPCLKQTGVPEEFDQLPWQHLTLSELRPLVMELFQLSQLWIKLVLPGALPTEKLPAREVKHCFIWLTTESIAVGKGHADSAAL